HLFMQQVGSDDGDGVDIRAPEKCFIVVSQVELVARCKWRRHFDIDIATGDDLEAPAIGKTGHNLFAPPTEANNSHADHCVSPCVAPTTMRASHLRRNGLALWRYLRHFR